MHEQIRLGKLQRLPDCGELALAKVEYWEWRVHRMLQRDVIRPDLGSDQRPRNPSERTAGMLSRCT